MGNQAIVDAGSMASQPEEQDGGCGSAEPTAGGFPSAVPSQDPHRTECNICGKRFKNGSHLNAHLADPLSHQPTVMIHCPVKNCQAKFKSAIGVANHVENGKIHKNLRQEDLTKALDTVFTYTATEAAFNGKAYDCYLCHKGKFKTLVALNSHLNSPAHNADEFKCPICQQEFKVVTNLAQHVETYACARDRVTVGKAAAQNVEQYLREVKANFKP